MTGPGGMRSRPSIVSRRTQMRRMGEKKQIVTSRRRRRTGHHPTQRYGSGRWRAGIDRDQCAGGVVAKARSRFTVAVISLSSTISVAVCV